jgi:hypothetical protein
MSPPAARRGQRDSAALATDATDVFAALLSMTQSGLGRRADVIASTLHHESSLFERPTDARQERIEQMSVQAKAQEAEGRSSRVDPGPRGGGEEAGPRGQRLALEKQDWAEKPPAQRCRCTAGGRAAPGGHT